MLAFLLRKKIYEGCYKSVIAQNYVTTFKTLDITDMCRLSKRTTKQIQVDHRYTFLGRDSFLHVAATWGTVHKTTFLFQHANTT